MSAHHHHAPIPRPVLLGAAALIGLALLLAGAGRFSGVGTLETPRADHAQSRQLRFVDAPDGGVVVYDAEAGRVVDVLKSENSGFVWGVMRGLARERMLNGVGADEPFRLVRGTNGELALEDPATGRVIDLNAFGPTNANAFARLLVADIPPK